MMRCLLVMLLGIGLPLASIEAATVYRTTDAQGNVVFTDKPIEGGQRIELQSLTVIPSAEPASSSDAAEPRKKASSTSSSSSSRRVGGPFMPYSTFRIASPEDGYTLQTGYAGDIAVDIGVEPALRKDHRIRLLVDGEVSQSAMHTQAFLLNGLNRGEHTLRAELLDAQGRVRHRSEPVTLYVHRASVNLPSNPNNPAGRPPGKTGN